MVSPIEISPWRTLRSQFAATWQQGQHVTALGANGSGKSTLLLDIARIRENVVLLLTKPRDPTLSDYIERYKYTKISSWPPPSKKYRIALWPPFRNKFDYPRMARTFENAINGYTHNKQQIEGIMSQGCWTVVADEMRMMQRLGLEDDMVMLLTQGRSNDISLLCGAQRPRHIPVEMLTEPTHLFLFHCSDKYDIDRLSEIGGRRTEEIKALVPKLKEYQFLYVNKRKGTLAISKVKR